MRNNIKILTAISLLVVVMYACSRKATDYESFLDGKEITYPGSAQNVSVLPGKYRLMLQWHPSPDPSVTKYVVYWNNYADSTIVQATTHEPKDTIECLISNLQEYSYTFFINSYDDKGNKSIVTEVDNARAYGSIYQNSLQNRPINIDTPYIVQSNQSDVLLNFLTPDTVNINTVVTYTNTSGATVKENLSADNGGVLLTNYKFGTPVTYQSSYTPKRGAIDTFTTLLPDTVPTIFKYVECSKSLFSALNLPYDIHDNSYGTHIESIWDGSSDIKGYTGDVHGAFCSDGQVPLANHFSIDLGATYNNISRIQEIGRNCCSNPIDFEVWGIADTTNAVSQLAGNDANWKTDVLSKGWTLLTEVVRGDDGQAAVTANFIDNPPPVRYIMIRVLKTSDGGSGTNLSQVTFWYKE
ncbi:hypothetical protein A9P82_02825 [Arachidicoccus ginsenosidimutans]|uniref:DUF4998 domain-containing protein n=1 Tax=Arachidicoccus sp. BS20 TaxID=1850526 RepID=UPI0007F14EB2|nr:DUF4998 domain-containing protein [Arachidicoccus sp. BS20]ANI88328.1 hypothetical protein A9P82_02825 [Arachidicoccus sp. BS20]